MSEKLVMLLLIIVTFIMEFLTCGCYALAAFKQRRIGKEDKIEIRVREHYKELQARGYEVVAVILQGSQNYNLAEYSQEYTSDVDTKAIVLPHFRDITNNVKPVSTTIILDNGEHIDVKDIRVMLETIKKMNLSYLELLYSKYKIINPKYKKLIQPLFDNRDVIVNMNPPLLMKCIKGMSAQEIETLEKSECCGKPLSHCARLCYWLKKWMCGRSIEECFDETEHREELMGYKKCGNRVVARETAATFDGEIKQIVDSAMIISSADGDEACKVIDDVKYNILKKKFKEDVCKK